MHGALMLTECSTVARLALHKSFASQLCNVGNIPRVKLKMMSSRNIAYLNVLIARPTNTCISKAKLSCCKSRLCSKAPCPHGGIQGSVSVHALQDVPTSTLPLLGFGLWSTRCEKREIHASDA